MRKTVSQQTELPGIQGACSNLRDVQHRRKQGIISPTKEADRIGIRPAPRHRPYLLPRCWRSGCGILVLKTQPPDVYPGEIIFFYGPILFEKWYHFQTRRPPGCSILIGIGIGRLLILVAPCDWITFFGNLIHDLLGWPGKAACLSFRPVITVGGNPQAVFALA